MKRVLLIGSHNLFLQALAVVLEQHTDLKEDVHAGSLGEARRVLADRDAKVDLAVIDLDVPDEDATELIGDLREVGIPVLEFTSCRSLKVRAHALRVGPDEVLSTASSGEQIIGTVKRLGGA